VENSGKCCGADFKTHPEKHLVHEWKIFCRALAKSMGPFPLQLTCIPQNIAPNCTVLAFKINCFDIKNEFSYHGCIFIHVSACHIGDNVVGFGQKLAFRSNHKSLSRSRISRSRKDRKTACFSMVFSGIFRFFRI
jgi:hypothetical protein